jgi:hypothetical protein
VYFFVCFQEAIESSYCYRIYLTEINKEFESDTFFPTFDKSTYRLLRYVIPRCCCPLQGTCMKIFKLFGGPRNSLQRRCMLLPTLFPPPNQDNCCAMTKQWPRRRPVTTGSNANLHSEFFYSCHGLKHTGSQLGRWKDAEGASAEAGGSLDLEPGAQDISRFRAQAIMSVFISQELWSNAVGPWSPVVFRYSLRNHFPPFQKFLIFWLNRKQFSTLSV